MAAPVWSLTVELDIIFVVVFIFIMDIMVFDPTIYITQTQLFTDLENRFSYLSMERRIVE